MRSKYSDDALDFIKENFFKLIDNYDQYMYIGCGGSIARGDAQWGSDIDLICIGENVKEYKKKFLYLQFPVECHFIPVDYIKYNFNIFAKVSNLESFEIEYNNNMLGAKFCKVISRKQDEMSVITSSWREIKKIVDAIDLYKKDGNIVVDLRKKIEQLSFKSVLLDMLNNALMGISDLDKFIVLLKVKMMTEKKVFSKVYWIDRYIEKMNTDESQTILENILIDEEVAQKAKEFVHGLMDNLADLYSQIYCEFCRNEMRNCNIYRCLYDYYQDSIKANKNHFKFAEYFSIAKVLEYAYLLFKHLNLPLEELENLKKVIVINPNIFSKIESIIAECVK